MEETLLHIIITIAISISLAGFFGIISKKNSAIVLTWLGMALFFVVVVPVNIIKAVVASIEAAWGILEE